MSTNALTLIHTSDWHLGHELHGHGREAEHDAFLDWLLDQLDTQDADALVVTGDVYDVANPPIGAMRRLYGFLAAATKRRPALRIVILGGNHDSAARINLPTALVDPERVYFFGALHRREGAPDIDRQLIPLTDKKGTIAAWLGAVPFCRPGDLGTESLQSVYAAMAQTGTARAGNLPLILTGHLHVAGGAISELSERRIVIGGEEAQASNLFDERAAYVALGHLHRAQDIAGPTRIRYAGSPFPLSVTERDYCHSISVCQFSPEQHQPIVYEVPIPRPVAFLSVPKEGPASLDAVVAELEALTLEALPRELQPFLEITVEVNGPEPHLQSRVLAALDGKFVRLTRIIRKHATVPIAAAGPIASLDLDELQPETVFAAMHSARHAGNAPSADLIQAFAQILVEVNICATSVQDIT